MTSTVAVAQLVESRIVIPVVVGSSPISHPKNFNGLQVRYYPTCGRFWKILRKSPPPRWAFCSQCVCESRSLSAGKAGR
ncbi:hypothetical protein CBM2606_A110269 [Cupriavidus taiwanensis]|nr:hypothetical protein CBM2606_A110269 [Cupriavidus taiwanensis]